MAIVVVREFRVTASAPAVLDYLKDFGNAEGATYHLNLEMHGLAKLATPVMKIEFAKLGDETASRLARLLGNLGAQAL